MKHCYQLVKVDLPLIKDGEMATAAFVHCSICHDAIESMGGPSNQYICQKCGEDILTNKR